VPQVVVARVHGLATAAGCQLVASCDLAVAAESAGFALPGGKGGWFCHTPAVPVARSIGRKRLMELALTGDVVDAPTALDWGLVNRVVPDDQLDEAVAELLARATRGSRASKSMGKVTLYAQLDRPEADAYAIALEVMAAASQLPGAREGMAARRIRGYDRIEYTHAAVAAFIASGMADAGLGVETAARQFHLGFVPLMMERYFLLVRRESLETPMIERLLAVMRSREFKAHLVGLQGLDSGRCGKVEELWQGLPSLAPAGAKRRKAATAG